ncbi:uncharacterized protein LOC123661420 [Melitaea cinxia]|uniref:uncharacterized protein LOC123661420 n=1 Tax=Melitaea cinxia TaxID=113334 RepID=UPI001E26EB38|nr:uncharacterized protein LOC123661420 [Melitaea cinxia]
MTISTRGLVQIAGWGGLLVATTGFYLQNKLVDRVRNFEYYKDALKILRKHPGAVYYLGEPIKDKKIKLSDTQNNFSDGGTAKLCVPVTGQKDRGFYYFWAEKCDDKWSIVKAELELKSKPDERLVIVKQN